MFKKRCNKLEKFEQRTSKYILYTSTALIKILFEYHVGLHIKVVTVTPNTSEYVFTSYKQTPTAVETKLFFVQIVDMDVMKFLLI